ncbi:MAG: phosphate ABC transporter ATP-binding protein, partial [Cyanobacteriota bacterium]|nr:phosphate ABC transporter ATP-binding protein [Cyanobacteriota bacterium]
MTATSSPRPKQISTDPCISLQNVTISYNEFEA